MRRKNGLQWPLDPHQVSVSSFSHYHKNVLLNEFSLWTGWVICGLWIPSRRLLCFLCSFCSRFDSAIRLGRSICCHCLLCLCFGLLHQVLEPFIVWLSPLSHQCEEGDLCNWYLIIVESLYHDHKDHYLRILLMQCKRSVRSWPPRW